MNTDAICLQEYCHWLSLIRCFIQLQPQPKSNWQKCVKILVYIFECVWFNLLWRVFPLREEPKPSRTTLNSLIGVNTSPPQRRYKLFTLIHSVCHSQIYWKQQNCRNIPTCFPGPESTNTSVSILVLWNFNLMLCFFFGCFLSSTCFYLSSP